MTEYAQRVRVLLAGDHAVVRQGVRPFLEADSGLEIAAEAADGTRRAPVHRAWRSRRQYVTAPAR